MPIAPYIILAVFVFGMNVIPALMPPTWTVLVFFYLTYGLFAIPVVIIGAVCATLGRVILYFIAQNRFRRFLPKKSQANLDYLSKFFNKKKKVTFVLLAAYAFSPIPSNQVYIMAGLAKIRIKLIATIFFLGRLLSYSLWIGSAHVVNKNLPSVFESHYSKAITFVIEIGGLIAIYFLTKVNWKKYLKV